MKTHSSYQANAKAVVRVASDQDSEQVIQSSRAAPARTRSHTTTESRCIVRVDEIGIAPVCLGVCKSEKIVSARAAVKYAADEKFQDTHGAGQWEATIRRPRQIAYAASNSEKNVTATSLYDETQPRRTLNKATTQEQQKRRDDRCGPPRLPNRTQLYHLMSSTHIE